ncbi:Protein CBG17730 [Caenorhabditis briggsae]|uniref:Uncharacterized protein n=2 Tax=Caenorhabditis briggsae TaxID=6238 RepID=A0AAE9D6X8_CAEBR|nr:Protein CBG17730 [Caenorhabditis briggsae]ULT96722.1 hypothetical protein L3Y34_004931 [Caenorhabditis briggsae]UMM29901.1 hypothetical protein L5515_012026 [Caenorhabditis briggsae]CAP35225.1 Protein CBG17730 [Caenorhabditis briggsae]
MISKVVFVALLAIATVHAKPGGRRSPPCGIPPFLDSLPEDAQEKINDIWKDYKEGDKCYEEQGLTREVIDALPKDARKNLHKRPTLPFLKGLPKETLAKFEEIFKDKSIKWSEKPEKIEALAEKELSGDNLKKFKEFKEKKEKEDKEYKEKESKLSDEAKTAHEKIEALNKQKFEILGDLSEKAKEELFDLWRSRPHFRGGRHGGKH